MPDNSPSQQPIPLSEWVKCAIVLTLSVILGFALGAAFMSIQFRKREDRIEWLEKNISSHVAGIVKRNERWERLRMQSDYAEAVLREVREWVSSNLEGRHRVTRCVGPEENGCVRIAISPILSAEQRLMLERHIHEYQLANLRTRFISVGLVPAKWSFRVVTPRPEENRFKEETIYRVHCEFESTKQPERGR